MFVAVLSVVLNAANVVVVDVFSDSADCVSCKAALSSVKIEEAHLRICLVGFFDENERVSTDSCFSVAESDSKTGRILNVLVKRLDDDEIVSG